MFRLGLRLGQGLGLGLGLELGLQLRDNFRVRFRFRDGSLFMGRVGGYKTGGGHVKFYPYKKGGGEFQPR